MLTKIKYGRKISALDKNILQLSLLSTQQVAMTITFGNLNDNNLGWVGNEQMYNKSIVDKNSIHII